MNARTFGMQVQLHAKSVWQVPGLWRNSAQQWDGFGDGRGVLAATEAREDLLDRIRFFAEECDAMQACFEPAAQRTACSYGHAGLLCEIGAQSVS